MIAFVVLPLLLLCELLAFNSRGVYSEYFFVPIGIVCVHVSDDDIIAVFFADFRRVRPYTDHVRCEKNNNHYYLFTFPTNMERPYYVL